MASPMKTGAVNCQFWFRNTVPGPGMSMATKACKSPVVRLRVKAEIVPVEARAGLWPKLTAMYPGYADYKARTRREIPVVILRPADRT